MHGDYLSFSTSSQGLKIGEVPFDKMIDTFSETVLVPWIKCGSQRSLLLLKTVCMLK